MRVQKTPLSRLTLCDDGILEAHVLDAFPAAMNAFLIPVRILEDEADARSWLLQFADPDLPVA